MNAQRLPISSVWLVEHAAAHLGRSQEFVRKYARQGVIPSKFIMGRYEFERADLDEWRERYRVKPVYTNTSQSEHGGVTSGTRLRKRDVRSLITKHTSRSGPGPS
jgi:hypothetical protein